MSLRLTTAIDTAASHSMAAQPQVAPALDIGGGTLGSLILGLILLTVIIIRWKDAKYGKGEKQAIIVTAVCCILLAGASGGLIADLMRTVQHTGGTVGESITSVSTGR